MTDYRCMSCGRVIQRESTEQWFKSWCTSTGRIARCDRQTTKGTDMAKKQIKKARNPQDVTVRNVRASKKRDEALAEVVEKLSRKVDRIMAILERLN